MFKLVLGNLIKVIKSPFPMFLGIIAGITIYFVINHFMDYMHILGNQGLLYANIEYYGNYVIAVLFGLIFASSSYKIFYFGSFNAKENSSSILGSFLSLISIGCPACGITIASYIGLSGLILSLPYSGIELKILGILIMLISLFFTLKNLEVCKMKKKK
ncbi:hypothetical protein [Candidatus Vampirococcus lugosii]|uniref:Sulphur transport domain-containing protein n=1 Tax=Candidatus Vampirococcus lugosii TaxID=2789015 RepID=A0ABS5QKE5_9BACT|nr:hypothetical protein [Candidatus Vampirococcus lugosii]MBS8121557.1 hypothetical protein [Candidatus Vampirococcus lugosii]